ncbi:hypothetical protein [Streptomyces griseorubiginosus]|uniref:hypothetical protein n=1 Tax=Streptomyces griseorubiginosus TaxID=67304 RepID=UPI002E81C59A|nr:hypothetical protein [Streptomyces griseorubiginosus]WUB42724.1 hypothetical protein OHN19_05015 [Streptomyces griseorubiginosus]WUB51243.1 hypothetical protein OG942_05010 [Streptomyces griseorubiginosus]
MRAIRVASAALLGMTALALSAPAAVAKSDNITPFGFSVLPSTIAAGGEVALLLERDHGGCKGSATVTSAVFDTITIPSHKSQAIAVVDWDARPGAVYRVTFTCDGVSGSTSLTIAGSRPVAPTPLPLHPGRGVQAGEGGSFAGFDLKEIGLGAALILGSVGTAYHLSRRRGGEDGA